MKSTQQTIFHNGLISAVEHVLRHPSPTPERDVLNYLAGYTSNSPDLAERFIDLVNACDESRRLHQYATVPFNPISLHGC